MIKDKRLFDNQALSAIHASSFLFKEKKEQVEYHWDGRISIVLRQIMIVKKSRALRWREVGKWGLLVNAQLASTKSRIICDGHNNDNNNNHSLFLLAEKRIADNGKKGREKERNKERKKVQTKNCGSKNES